MEKHLTFTENVEEGGCGFLLPENIIQVQKVGPLINWRGRRLPENMVIVETEKYNPERRQ